MRPRLTEKVLRGLELCVNQIEADPNGWNHTDQDQKDVRAASAWLNGAWAKTEERRERRKRRDTGPAPTTYWL